MKPYTKLTRADLQQSPILAWVSESKATTRPEEFDESWVEQTEFSEIPFGPFTQFLVAASIELKNGDNLPGIAEATVSGSVVSVQATTLFLLDRHLQIPGVETNRLISRYTKSIENHPVAWRLLVPVQGEAEPRKGNIAGGDMKDLVAIGEQVLLGLKALRKK